MHTLTLYEAVNSAKGQLPLKICLLFGTVVLLLTF